MHAYIHTSSCSKFRLPEGISRAFSTAHSHVEPSKYGVFKISGKPPTPDINYRAVTGT